MGFGSGAGIALLYFILFLVMIWGAAAVAAFIPLARKWPIFAWIVLIPGWLMFEWSLFAIQAASPQAGAQVAFSQFLNLAGITLRLSTIVIAGRRYRSQLAKRAELEKERPRASRLTATQEFLVVVLLLMMWAVIQNYRSWRAVRLKSVASARTEMEFWESRLSAEYTSTGYRPIGLGMSGEVLFFDQGGSCYTRTSSELLTWDLHRGRDVGRVGFPFGYGEVANSSNDSQPHGPSVAKPIWDPAAIEHIQSFACSADGRVVAVWLDSRPKGRMMRLSPHATEVREVFRVERGEKQGTYQFAVPGLPDNGQKAWCITVRSVGSSESVLTLLDLTSGKAIVEVPVPPSIGVVLSNDLQMLALIMPGTSVGKPQSEVRVLNAVTGEVLCQGDLPSAPTPATDGLRLAVDASHSRIAYESNAGVVLCEFDKTGRLSEKQSWPKTEAGTVGAMRFSSDGNRLAVFFRQHFPNDWMEKTVAAAIDVYDIAEGTTTVTRMTVNPTLRSQYQGITPDLKVLIVPSDRAVYRYNVTTGKELLRGEAVE